MRSLLLAVAMPALWLAGCRCDGPEPPPFGEGPTCLPPDPRGGEIAHPIHAPRDVELHVAYTGKAPKQRLRYALKKGTAFSFEVLPILHEEDPGNAAGMTILVEGEVACAATDGTARLDYRLGLRGSLAEGARAYAIVDNRGFITQGALLATIPVDERGVTHPREGLPIPVPEPPVGVGAVWTVDRTLDTGVRQSTTFEVVGIDGSEIRTKVRIQAVMPSGESAPGGAGSTTFDLTRPTWKGWFLLDGPGGTRAGLRVVPR